MTIEENNREREFNRPRLLRQWRKHNPGVRIRPMLAHNPNCYVTDDGRIFALRREENRYRGKYILAERPQSKVKAPGAFRGGAHNYLTVVVTVSAPNRRNFPNINFSSSSRIRFRTHTLVAYYFCTREFFDRTQVDHIDGNPTNNHASNLEWVTPAENYRRAKELRRLKKLKTNNYANRI